MASVYLLLRDQRAPVHGGRLPATGTLETLGRKKVDAMCVQKSPKTHEGASPTRNRIGQFEGAASRQPSERPPASPLTFPPCDRQVAQCHLLGRAARNAISDAANALRRLLAAVEAGEIEVSAPRDRALLRRLE